MRHSIMHESLSLSSPFLITLIVTAVVMTAIALAFSYWKRAAAADRYLALSIALVAPLIAATLLVTPVPNALRRLFGPEATPAAVAATVQRIEVTGVAVPSSETACVLFSIWLAGVLAFAVLTTRQAIRWRRVAQRSLPLSHPRILPMRTAVTTSPAAAEPMVVGILHPAIVLPPDYVDALDDAELRAVFTHELEHVRRRDNLHAVLHEVLTALFWFDPLHWIARRRLLELRERACDERVLAAGCHPRHYVSALAKSCHVAVESAAIACMSGFHIRERIESIMSYSSRRSQFVSAKGVRLISVLLALVVAGGFALTAPAPSLAAEGSWRVVAETDPTDPLRFLVTVYSPENEVVSRANATTQPGIPFDMTSTHAAYTYKIKVDPTAAMATLEVREGGTVLHRTSSPVRKGSTEPISMNVKDADIHDILSVFAQLTGRKFVADPSLQGTVTLDAIGVPWDLALSEAIAPLGLVAETRGNEIHIVPAKAPRLDLDTMTPPKILTRVEPVYPPDAKEKKIQGIVIVEAFIDEAGRVTETRVLGRQPMGLSEAAEDAVRQWTFQPALKDGKPIAVLFNVTINFKAE